MLFPTRRGQADTLEHVPLRTHGKHQFENSSFRLSAPICTENVIPSYN